MWADQALLKLSDKNIYHRRDLLQIFQREKDDLSDSAFRWVLYNLQREQKLFRIDYDTYITKKPKIAPKYRPVYSDRAKTVMEFLRTKFSDLEFVVLESMLLNEFLNHQIAQNTIYVQVEKDVSSYIFDILQEEYTGSVLYRPGTTDFDRYWTKDCIVVLNLISQSPLSSEDPHEITAEKLLVDIVAEKSVAVTFSLSERPFIFENMMENYQIDRHRLSRYAGRRGKTELIKKYTGGKALDAFKIDVYG